MHGVCMEICTGIIGTVRFYLVLIAILMVPFLPTNAQSQNEASQQLKDKLQKLEQEIQELKEQIDKVQQAPAPATTKSTVEVRAAEEAQETPAEKQPEENKNTVDLYGHVMLDSGY